MTAPVDTTRASGLLAVARARLVGLEAADPAQEARELLEWATGADSIWSIREPVDPSAVERFHEAVERRARREPLQRITGRMHFRGLVLESRPGVFVCRPETEIVAGLAIDAAREAVLDRERHLDEPCALVVDLCTGSGAIAAALASEVPACRVVAVELGEEAHALAASNLERLVPGRARLVRGDATDPGVLADLDGRVDVVVSNPPYVPASEAPTQAEALLDPPLALYGGGRDGADAPIRIIARAAALLRPGGVLVVEHSPSQSALMREAALASGFESARTEKDLAGRDRALVARRGTIHG